MAHSLVVSPQDWRSFVARAKDLGFLHVGAAANHDVKVAEPVRSWVRDGNHGDMHWYARGLEKRLNLNLVLDEAASVLVLTTPYNPKPCSLAGKKLARYACGDDYHDVLKPKLWNLIELLKQSHPEGTFRPYVDTGPILERYWAQQSGLGWIGKNGNLINREAGSYLFLACIVTNLEVPYGRPHEDFCGSCRACIDACPTDAIIADGVVDSRKCISYLNIEQRGPFQDAPPFEDWIFGCDICQEVCPWTHKFSREPLLAAFLERDSYASLEEDALLEMDQETFSATFRKSAVKRTKRAGLQRNLNHILEKM